MTSRWKWVVTKEVALPSALAPNTRRIIDEKSALVAITTQEGIDGYREKATRTAHVEQIELISFMELLPVLKRTRQSIPLWRNVAEQSRWMEPEESQPSDICHLREQTHHQLIDEEREICSAALKKLVDII